MKSDIEIAQSADMRPIKENAEQYMNKVKAAGFGAFIVEVDNNA